MNTKKKIAVLSGKGGVGKTTVAINLALALHQLGEKTLLVDANLTNPHIGLHLGSPYYEGTVHDALNATITHARSIQKHPAGLSYVPGDLRAPPVRHQEDLSVYGRLAAYTIFDAPPGNAMDVLPHVDQVLIVTQAKAPALADALRIMLLARSQHKVVMGIMLNKHTGQDLSIEQVENYLGNSVMAVIPDDKRFAKALHHQEPFVVRYPKSVAAKEFMGFARRLTQRP